MFEQGLNIRLGVNIKEIHFKNCIIQNKSINIQRNDVTLYLINTECEDISIPNHQSPSIRLVVDGRSIVKGEFNKIAQINSFEVRNGTFCKNLDFSSFNTQINIFKGKFKDIKTGRNTINIKSENSFDIEINSLIVDLSLASNLNLHNTKVSTLNILGERNNKNASRFSISNVKIKEIIFRDFKNTITKDKDDEFLITNLIPLPSAKCLIKFLNSVPKLSFNNCDLSKFDSVIFADSDISNIKYQGVIWNTNIQALKKNNESSEYETYKKSEHHLKNLQLREAYMQFKNLADSHRDKVQEMIFKSHELKVYRKLLSWRKNFANKLSLSIAHFISNNGLNWWWPAFLFIFLVPVFYTILLTIHHYDCKFWYYWVNKDLFILANPIHKISDLSTENQPNTFGGLLIEYISRICLSILLYELVSSFRKYGKK